MIGTSGAGARMRRSLALVEAALEEIAPATEPPAAAAQAASAAAPAAAAPSAAAVAAAEAAMAALLQVRQCTFLVVSCCCVRSGVYSPHYSMQRGCRKSPNQSAVQVV